MVDRTFATCPISGGGECSHACIQDEPWLGECTSRPGNIRRSAPFNNIVSAEAQHISEMTVLFEKYGLAVPADESADHLHPVADVKEALETCVAGEVDNIAMYNKFLEQELPDDVRAALRLCVMLRKDICSHSKSLEKY